jgi:putative nucleotidyltransferase with HDIG domain
MPLFSDRSLCFWKAPRSSTLVVLAIVSLTGTLGHRFYNEPKLDTGTISPDTIKAPATVQIEDEDATEEKRRVARSLSGFVYVLDAPTNQQINAHLQKLLNQTQTFRQTTGAFPVVPVSTLSIPAQAYLRQLPEADWQPIEQMMFRQTAEPQGRQSSQSQPDDHQRSSAIAELRRYQQTNSGQSFQNLVSKLKEAQRKYQLAQETLIETGQVSEALARSLSNLSDSDWQKTQTGVQKVAQRMLAQGITSGLAPSVLESAAQTQLSEEVPEAAKVGAKKLLTTVLRPNLIKDPTLSQQRAEVAANAVELVLVPIRKGEVIVRKGERITRANFVLLDHFKLSRRGIYWSGLAGFALLVSGAIVIFGFVRHRCRRQLCKRDYFLVLLLALSAPILATIGATYTSLPMIGVLISSFYGPVLGVTSVALLTALMPVGIDLSWRFLLSSAAGGLLGGLLAGRMRSREELALLGGGVGLTQGLVYFMLYLLIYGSTSWVGVLGTAALHGLIGFAWCVVALGLSPYLEHLFDLITPIRLAELSSPNRPLLKRLAAEAPGTFQHTLFVATLAEAAAQALGCNVELVRAGTLYHDIGKLHDPQGFIENQMSGPNKHDLIDDPYLSAEIIKKHVTEGLSMARKCRLPRAIRAFIPEHQGTMLIAYFYYQAQERGKQEPETAVNEAEFRYDGPIPQSRETGIVMLADSCEAALRSLKDATPQIALATVNKILRARWQDQQLADSGLKREEMSVIAEIFVQVWQQHNHQRIAYPKAALTLVTAAQRRVPGARKAPM